MSKLLAIHAAVATLAGFASVAQATPSFTVSTFATAPIGASAPDSITTTNGSVWVSYAGGTSADGSLPAGFSTVVQYSVSGQVQNSYQIAGSVDGLKMDPNSGRIWALQNQDANSSLTVINPVTGTRSPMTYAATSGTQGYDDVAFTANGTFLSTTNPVAATDPILQKVVPGTTPIQVTTVVTAGQPGMNIATGTPGFLPAVQDTDSLKVAPNGDLVQTTGNRDTLLFIHDAGQLTQSLRYLTLNANGASVTGLDDSLFITSASGKIFATTTSGNRTVQIDYSGVAPGTLVASIGSLYELAFVDQTTGDVTPFVTGISGIHGLAVAAVPEPAGYALMLAGIIGIAAVARRRQSD